MRIPKGREGRRKEEAAMDKGALCFLLDKVEERTGEEKGHAMIDKRGRRYFFREINTIIFFSFIIIF